MVYMGSKAKYKKYILPILQNTIDKHNVTIYIEPFCGGCNIIDDIKCKHKYAFDRSDTLIALLKQAAENPDLILKEGNRELWDKGKEYVKNGKMPNDMSLAEIGAMEFFASFSKGGFPRGYAKNTETRDYFQEAKRNLIAQAPKLRDINFKCQNYWELDLEIKNAVIYCDPPYQGTKLYGYSNQSKMDYNHFWSWIRQISKNNYVFISEQNAPNDFNVLWEQEVKRTTNKDNNFKAVEKLFYYSGGLEI